MEVGPRGGSGLVQEQEGEEASRFGFGKQVCDQSAQGYGRCREVTPEVLLSGRGRVPLVVDEVDDMEHRVKAFRECRVGWNLVGYPMLPDGRLGPRQAFLHRFLGHEEGPGDLCCGQPAHHAQGEGDPRVDGQRRVAAGEDEPELVIVEDVAVPCLGYRVGPFLASVMTRQLGPSASPPNRVDPLELAG